MKLWRCPACSGTWRPGDVGAAVVTFGGLLCKRCGAKGHEVRLVRQSGRPCPPEPRPISGVVAAMEIEPDPIPAAPPSIPALDVAEEAPKKKRGRPPLPHHEKRGVASTSYSDVVFLVAKRTGLPAKEIAEAMRKGRSAEDLLAIAPRRKA